MDVPGLAIRFFDGCLRTKNSIGRVSCFSMGPDPSLQSQLNEGLNESIPNALFGPTVEAHIYRIPLSVALMHVAPWTSDPKNMQHAIQVSSIIVRGSGLPTAFGGQQSLGDPPFDIRQVATSQNRS